MSTDAKTPTERVLHLAMMIALETPATRSKYSHTAYVRWKLIEQLRTALNDIPPATYDRCRQAMIAITKTRAEVDAIVAAETKEPA